MPPCYQQVHEGGMKRQVDPSHDVKGGGEDNRHIPDPSSPDSGTRTRRQRPDDFTGCGGGRRPHTPLPPLLAINYSGEIVDGTWTTNWDFIWLLAGLRSTRLTSVLRGSLGELSTTFY